MLGMPSNADQYKRKYMASFKPHRLAQLLISRAIDYPKEDMSMFKDRYLGLRDHATQARIMESDFLDCVMTSPIRDVNTAHGFYRAQSSVPHYRIAPYRRLTGHPSSNSIRLRCRVLYLNSGRSSYRQFLPPEPGLIPTTSIWKS